MNLSPLPVILIISFVAFIISLWIFDAVDRTRPINTLRERKPVTKVEMKVVSQRGVNNITILDKKLLDTINNALQEAKDTNIQRGGAFETWADFYVYKSGNKIKLSIQHSAYNGWMIEIGSKTLTNQYLFDLVSRYSK